MSICLDPSNYVGASVRCWAMPLCSPHLCVDFISNSWCRSRTFACVPLAADSLHAPTSDHDLRAMAAGPLLAPKQTHAAGMLAGDGERLPVGDPGVPQRLLHVPQQAPGHLRGERRVGPQAGAPGARECQHVGDRLRRAEFAQQALAVRQPDRQVHHACSTGAGACGCFLLGMALAARMLASFTHSAGHAALHQVQQSSGNALSNISFPV